VVMFAFYWVTAMVGAVNAGKDPAHQDR